MTKVRENNIIKDSYKVFENYTTLFSDNDNGDSYRLSDLTKKSVVENYLYDIICYNKIVQLFEESNIGKWNNDFNKEIDEAYDLLSENWPILQKYSMYGKNYHIIKKAFKKIYKKRPRLCTALFPVIFFIIVENIQKIEKKSSDELDKFINGQLFGMNKNDYIYSLIDVDAERKVSKGEKRRKQIQKIFEESEDIKYIYDLYDDILYNIVEWNDNTIDQDSMLVDKVRSTYLRKYRKSNTKVKNAEKMYALFQFISKLWEQKEIKHFKDNDKMMLG